MTFVSASPDLAVEVRSERDCGLAAEREMAAKREDFEAGTRVVWDVDPESGTIRKYSAADPTRFVTFATGELADAEPASPGWNVSVD